MPPALQCATQPRGCACWRSCCPCRPMGLRGSSRSDSKEKGRRRRHGAIITQRGRVEVASLSFLPAEGWVCSASRAAALRGSLSALHCSDRPVSGAANRLHRATRGVAGLCQCACVSLQAIGRKGWQRPVRRMRLARCRPCLNASNSNMTIAVLQRAGVPLPFDWRLHAKGPIVCLAERGLTVSHFDA